MNPLTVCVNQLIYVAFLVPQFNVSPTCPRLHTFLFHFGRWKRPWWHRAIIPDHISHSASLLKLMVFGTSGQRWGAEGEWRCCSHLAAPEVFAARKNLNCPCWCPKLGWLKNCPLPYEGISLYAFMPLEEEVVTIVSYSQGHLFFQVKKMEEGIMFAARVNLLKHGLSQLGISDVGFTPRETIQRGITLHVILSVSGWVFPSLIQPYKGLSPGPSQTALLASSGKQCRCPRWYGEEAWTKHLLRDSKRALCRSQEKKGTRQHRVEPQWYPGAQMSFSFNYWRGLFVLYWPFFI